MAKLRLIAVMGHVPTSGRGNLNTVGVIKFS
jgi:hypothetical protein